VIYPAWPQLYVQDVEYIRLLLEPIMRYVASGSWPLPYPPHDMGSRYPNATGHDNGIQEDMPIEESGNLLILALLYQKLSGNSAWAAKYSSIFKQYADYCFKNGLYPANQLSTDDGPGPAANQTNLAVKAAIGLASYGALFNDHSYTTKGQQFATTIFDDGIGLSPDRTHFTFSYNQPNSWGMTFNLFPDWFMKLDTFNSSAFAVQSAFYPTVRAQAGVSLDSLLNWGKTDWQIHVAAMAPDSVKSLFVNDLHAFISNGLNDGPFGDRWFTGGGTGVTGGSYGFRNRPVVGGEWALLAVQGPL
jgi:hypothetical protein